MESYVEEIVKLSENFVPEIKIVRLINTNFRCIACYDSADDTYVDYGDDGPDYWEKKREKLAFRMLDKGY